MPGNAALTPERALSYQVGVNAGTAALRVRPPSSAARAAT